MLNLRKHFYSDSALETNFTWIQIWGLNDFPVVDILKTCTKLYLFCRIFVNEFFTMIYGYTLVNCSNDFLYLVTIF